jgi:hypothetical protein
VKSLDDGTTIAAIGLLAYVSADVAHHAFGHAGACLALGGSVVSLSSVYVDCSLHGVAIDLAGPLANLLLGLVALGVARAGRFRTPAWRLFWAQVAAFNLLWLWGQLAFSAASGTDDWAWALERAGATEPIRAGLVAFSLLAYLLTIRVVASDFGPFAQPRERARRIVRIAWLAAGVMACTTAALDPHPGRAIVLHALPQSVLLSIGLLFVPARAARSSAAGDPAAAIDRSVPWLIAAGVAGVASILVLGPGMAIAI